MSHQQMPMIITEVGRKVEFRVTKARVSFPRRESYGLEARFKVNQNLCVFVFSVCEHLIWYVVLFQVWVESRELEMLRRSTIDCALPR